MAYSYIPNLEERVDYSQMTEHEARIAKRLRDPDFRRFELRSDFVESYKNKDPGFGFNGLGELTYLRTYSRVKQDGNNEKWYETIARVVEGTYNLQKRRIEQLGKEWKEHQAEKSAEEMYDRMFYMKFLPPGRGLWAMGSAITEEKGLYAALNNCGFVSTDNLSSDLERPFTFLMDASMLGVGVGFDTKGTGQILIKKPDSTREKEVYVIPDTREGWVKSMGILLRSYFLGDPVVEFDYSRIRPEGEPIKTFGGKASGPGPLKESHDLIRETLEKSVKRPISATNIVDIMNIIGSAVVAGNVRRTAEIAFGEPNSDEFLNLKNYKLNPQRERWGWASNNSIFAGKGMDYSKIAERIINNGEPGLIFLDNMQGFGRMIDPRNDKDAKVKGCNPCAEQSLESYELCCLVENFPGRASNLDEFLRTLKFSYLYAKTATLGETHWPETNEVMARNRRIGSSVTGIAQVLNNSSMNELRGWLDKGYHEIQRWDEIYSDWLAVPRSKKTTSVKPSGTISLVAGSTPGIHYPQSEYYIRRIRVAKNSDLVSGIKEAGYFIEDDVADKSSFVVEIPVHVGKNIRTQKEVSMLEQMELAAMMQAYWADNQVSATITFDPETEGPKIRHVLPLFEDRLKSVSLLPRTEKGAFPQMPYEEINQEEYEKRIARIKPLSLNDIRGESNEGEKFCNNNICELNTEEERIKKLQEI
jgi:ribonucleoside-triphosphate reductase (thioredoxin)